MCTRTLSHCVCVVGLLLMTTTTRTPAAPVAAYGGGVLFVDRGACVGGDGLSWDTAFIELQSALDVVAEDDTVTAINVAEGIYKPSARTDPLDARTATFLLPDGVVLRGGFAGFGAPDPDERDIDLYETVLTGDLNVGVPSNDCCMIHDTPGCSCGECAAEVCEILPDCCEVAWDELCVVVAEAVCGDMCDTAGLSNSYHVVRASGVDETTVLDGFTITGGKANGSCCVNDRSGGMYLSSASPTVINCDFIGNIASNVAGAIWLSHSAPTFIGCEFKENVVLFSSGGGAAIHDVFESDLTLIDCVFQDNTVSMSSGGGGAVFVGGPNQASSVVAVSCIFVGNSASVGGAIANNGPADISNCLFIGNSALRGGAFSNNGLANFLNCLFVGNAALGGGSGEYDGKGGAIFNFRDLTITNSTFAANTAIDIGGGIFAGHIPGDRDPDSVIAVDNCILWGNTGAGTTEQQQIGVGGPDVFVNYSCVEGLTGDLGGTGNIGADPLFVDPDGKDDIPGTEDDDLHLLSGSPCIDAADNTAVPKGIDTDLDGNPRFVDDPATKDTGNGDPPIVDMGAYEFQVVICPWDLNGNGTVGVGDLLILVGNFGPCDGECPADFDGDGFVGVLDLLALIANFGECPGTGCPWDVNGDGVVDHLDVMAVNDNMGPCNDPDNCPWDVNGDGVVDGADVSEVATHFGPCPKVWLAAISRQCPPWQRRRLRPPRPPRQLEAVSMTNASLPTAWSATATYSFSSRIGGRLIFSA